MTSKELMTPIEKEYWRRINAMPVYERVERASRLAMWAREMIAQQILAEKGPRSEERLRWEVAQRVYISDRRAQITIEQQLASLSD